MVEKSSSDSVKKRIIGIDLLRILSVFFVIVLHFIGISQPNFLSNSYYLSNAMKALCFCCVDAFAIISGYVGLKSKHEIKNIVGIWFTVVFYALIVLFFSCVITKTAQISAMAVIKTFLPVITFRHWYFSAYFILFFFMPIIIKFVQEDDCRNHLLALSGLILMSVIGTVLNSADALWSIGKGFSVFWLFMMYYLGALLRKYHIGINRLKAFLLYLLCCFIIWVSVIVFSLMGFDQERAEMLFNYASPFTILSAVSLVFIFQDLSITRDSFRKIIKSVSSTTFSIYIIHYDKVVWKWIVTIIPVHDNTFSLEIVLGISVVIFLVCSLIDMLRIRLFAFLGISSICSIVQECSEKILDCARTVMIGSKQE